MKTKLVRLLSCTVMVATTFGAIAKDSNDLVVDGEHMTVRQITDPKLNNIVAYRYFAPKKWKDSGAVTWNLFHSTHPSRVSFTVENPANSEEFFFHQAMICGYLPPGRFVKTQEGQDTHDGLWLHPMKPQDALSLYIKKARSQCSDLKFIGSRDLPDLPKALKVNMANNQHGIAEKVTYTFNGKPVEEEFYAVHYYNVVQGEALWGLVAIHSFRAPTGTIDKRRNVFAAIAKSFTMSPEFSQRLTAIQNQIWARHQANMKAKMDEIHAAGERSKANAAADDQFLANVDRSLVAQRNSGGGSGGGSASTRTGNDGEDDYIRDVVTMNDPATGTSQQSFLQQYHWTDGYGNYRGSNDPNYDANKSEVGSWQLMTPAQ